MTTKTKLNLISLFPHTGLKSSLLSRKKRSRRTAFKMSLCEEREEEAPVDAPRAASPFSSVSMKSNNSMPLPPGLSDVDAQRATSPGFSCVSMKSNNSMPLPPGLSDVDAQRATSPGFSCVSMKSNNSMPQPPELSDGPTVTFDPL